MKYPRISIVTPNYNQAPYIEETIQSVLNQNYPNLEYIVIDGGSTDGSVEIIKKYEDYLTYWVSEKDGGMYHAIQKGFALSTGEIMAWINSDDMYHRNAFYTVSEIFSTYSQIEWLTGCNTNFDETGRTFNARSAYPQNRFNMFLNPSKHIQQESTFWRRTLWERAGGTLDLTQRYAGDFELWARFFRYASLYRTDALIGGFRVRKNQISQLYMPQYTQECDQILEREKGMLTFYERCMMDEIRQNQFRLLYDRLNEIEKNELERQIALLADEPEKVVFDTKAHHYFLQGELLEHESLLSDMYKKRNKLDDFLEYLKTRQKFYPEVIVDVGVAHGTPELYTTYPKSQIILVEPLQEFEPHMLAIQSAYENVIIERVAAGSASGTMTICVHPDLVGSSVYKEAEESDVNGIERIIDVKTLDEIYVGHIEGKKEVLLKIDVQGAELDVLRGAKRVLEDVEVIVLEVSLHRFFIGGADFSDVVAHMKGIGYVPYDIFGFMNRPYDGSLAQVDMAFVKENGRFKEINYFATPEQREILNHTLQNMKGDGARTVADRIRIDFSQKFNNLYRHIDTLMEADERYVIYGHGTVGKTLFGIMAPKAIAFIDKQSDKIAAGEIERGGVYSLESLKNIRYDKIIISVLGREEEIEQDLVSRFGIDKNRMVWLKV